MEMSRFRVRVIPATLKMVLTAPQSIKGAAHTLDKGGIIQRAGLSDKIKGHKTFSPL